MIEYSKKDIFKNPSDCLVNPVNCEGVMGKGLALEFKKKFPHNFKMYEIVCKDKRLEPGKLAIVEVKERPPKFIVNFPTKKKFSNPSKYEYIEKGLDRLIWHLPYMGIKSISIPALGCGLGKLEWKKVKKIILDKFDKYTEDPEFKIVLFDPK